MDYDPKLALKSRDSPIEPILGERCVGTKTCRCGLNGVRHAATR